MISADNQGCNIVSYRGIAGSFVSSLTVLPLAVGGDREVHSVHRGEAAACQGSAPGVVVLVLPLGLRARRVAYDGHQSPRLPGDRERERDEQGESLPLTTVMFGSRYPSSITTPSPGSRRVLTHPHATVVSSLTRTTHQVSGFNARCY